MPNLITFGFRCTTDSCLSAFNLRNFSGPFSYLICDFETAIDLIKTDFKDYFTNIIKIGNTDAKIKYLPHWRQTNPFYVNTYYTKENITNVHYYLKNILLWNHHDMTNKETIETFNRRTKRILQYLKNEDCILFYIDRVFESENLDDYIDNIKSIIKINYNFNHKIIYVIPFSSTKYIDFDTKLYYEDNILNIWLLKTTPMKELENQTKKQNKQGTPLLDTDIQDKNIHWSVLMNRLKAHYSLK